MEIIRKRRRFNPDLPYDRDHEGDEGLSEIIDWEDWELLDSEFDEYLQQSTNEICT